MMNYQTIELQRDGHCATVWLNRPDVRNAFDDAMIAELTQAFTLLGNDPQVRVIVLAARGSVFCAGADLHWMKAMAGYNEAENRADAARLAQMLQAIYACSKPVIAKVQGDCYGGGVGLVAACDIAVAADAVQFCLSEVKIGLIPATIAPYVVRAMGARAAHRYVLTAERFSAQQAHAFGFAHAVVNLATLDAKVAELVHALLAASPHALQEAKRLLQDVAGAELHEGLIADTVERIAAIRSSEEGREGVQAFLEKRKPGWIKD